MKTVVTRGIVLARTNFQEADRIITVLTPDQGKLRLVAKGVRRPKSKLAGGIELFSVGDLTFMRGKGELGTLISSRLATHYGNIVKDINRTMYGYEFLKKIHKISEEAVEPGYFELAEVVLGGLDDASLSLDSVDLWSTMRLLVLTGHMPNLQTDTAGDKLMAEGRYVFSFDDMTFAPTPQGEPIVDVAKVLRLASTTASLQAFAKVQGMEGAVPPALQLAKTMERYALL